MKSVFICCSAILACSVIACAPAKNENTGSSPVKPDISVASVKVELSVAPSVKAAIDKVTPTAKYVYFVVKGTEPKSDSDLEKRTLFACCDVPLENVGSIVENAIPSLKAPQFAGVQAYLISANVSNSTKGPGEIYIAWEMSQNHIEYKGRKFPFVGKELAFGRTATMAQIQQRAIQDMRTAGNGVLVLSRGSQAPAPDFVEVVFK